MDNTAFFKLSYGLFVVTAHEGDKDNGCITNTVVQQTTTPNRISVTINKNNYTHDMIKRTGVFNVSVLSEKSKFETFKHWGFQSGKDVDKTVGITYFRLENGVIYIVDGVNAKTLQPPMPFTTRTSSPHHSRQRRKDGYARCVDISMRERCCLRISSVLHASILPLTSRE